MEKHLQNEEARKKFKELVEEIKVCMFITATQSDHEHTRPMYAVDVDREGSVWFFTDIRSIKVEEVTVERDVHLVFSHPGKESYMDVWGKASVNTDRALIKEKWNPMIKAWFPGGSDDPNVALLQVKPTNVYYWDTEAGKMVEFIKTIVGAITSNPKIAEGKEGKLVL